MAGDKYVGNRKNDQGSGQERIGFMTIAGWDQLLHQVNQQIEEMEQLPLPEVKDKMFALLEGIDAIHRESLSRLVSLFKEGVLEQVITDPPIHTLMELYDLLPPEIEEEEEDDGPQFDDSGFPTFPVRVITEANKKPPLKPKYPRWIPVPEAAGTLPPDSTKVMDIDGYSILLCRVGDEYFAMASSCGQDGASLSDATLSKYTLTCHNHEGCHYDIRMGTRIAARGSSIDCYPVEVSENDKDRVMIGLDMEFVPNVPVF